MKGVGLLSRDRFGPEYYDADYYEADLTGGKAYRKPDGTIAHWGYHARAEWMGWNHIIPVMKRMFKPKRVIDLGSGCGSIIKYLRRFGVEALGADFSRWCVTHPLVGAEKGVYLADVRHLPFKDGACDLLTGLDIVEHLYEPDLDIFIEELYRVSNKWIFLNIGGIMFPDLYRHVRPVCFKKGEKIPPEYEGLTLAGHVTVQYRDWWLLKLIKDKINQGWSLRPPYCP